MKYYKHFEFPNWQEVSKNALDYYIAHKDDYKCQSDPWFKQSKTDDILKSIPALNTLLNPIDATISEVWFFEYSKQDYCGETFIHSDGASYNTRLLFPLLNCENTETRFYSSDRPLIPVTPASVDPSTPRVSYPCVPDPESESPHVDTLYIAKGPALIRVNELHCPIIPENNTFPRIIMLINTVEDLTHLLD